MPRYTVGRVNALAEYIFEMKSIEVFTPLIDDEDGLGVDLCYELTVQYDLRLLFHLLFQLHKSKRPANPTCRNLEW